MQRELGVALKYLQGNPDLYNSNTRIVLLIVMALISKEHQYLFGSPFFVGIQLSHYVIYSMFNIFHFFSDSFFFTILEKRQERERQI